MDGGTNELRKRAGIIFDAAIALPKEERAVFVKNSCLGDVSLQERVNSLLRAHEAAGEFMERPALDLLPAQNDPTFKDQSGERIGRYKLLQAIGEGGCGVVYLAEQEEPIRRRVALKIIKLGMDTRQVIARFEAERQALALMDHPNIAKIYDAGATETGRPYFVMELVDGLKITEHCDRHQLTTGQRLALFAQVCGAVQHAHHRSVIHRDLKPSNILVCIQDGIAVPKVIDFGIARATGDQRLTDKTLFTAFEQFLGTPAYMSPEQAGFGRSNIDTRTDIYSLGVLLYELLTGQPPFDNEKLKSAALDQVLTIIREEEPPRPSTRLSKLAAEQKTHVALGRQIHPERLAHLLRGDLDWIVMKAMEKDRARRYATAADFAEDVRRHLRNELVAARSPGRGYQLRKFIHRNRMLFTGTLTILVALLAGFSFATWGWWKQWEARRQIALEKANELHFRQRADAEANLSRAIDLLKSREYAAAEDLLDSIPAELRLEDSRLILLRRSLGWYHAFQNQWLQAASNLNELVQIDLRAGNLEAASTDAYFELPVLVETGDTNAVEALRTNALSWFGGSTNLSVTTRLYSICLFSPASGDVLAGLDRWREPLIGAVRDADDGLDHWICFNVGLLEYRRGNFTNAAAACRQTLGYAPASYRSRVSSQILLAMSNYRLGRTNEARLDLAYARETVEECFRNGARALADTVADPIALFDWENDRVLLREAVGLIGNPPAGNGSLHSRVNEQFKRVDDLRTAVQLDEAEAALREIPPESLVLEGKRAGTMIRLMGWRELVNGSRRLAAVNWGVDEYGPDGGAGMMEGRELSDFYVSYASLLVELRDNDGYEKLRRAALAKYGETCDPLKAEPLLLACLLTPADDTTLARLATLAQVVQGSQLQDLSWTARTLDSQALLACRRGNYAQALPILQKSQDAACSCPSIDARTHILKALALCHVDEGERADAELTLCRSDIEKGFNQGKVVIGIDDSGTWCDWWIDNFLLREVTSCLSVNPASPQTIK